MYSKRDAIIQRKVLLSVKLLGRIELTVESFREIVVGGQWLQQRMRGVRTAESIS